MFNPKVAQLVEGLTKISLVQKDMNVSMQAEISANVVNSQ
jgi:GTP pyrophosphokinase